MRSSEFVRSLPLRLLCTFIAALALIAPGCDGATSAGVLSRLAASSPELAQMVRSAELRPARREGRGARLETTAATFRARAAGAAFQPTAQGLVAWLPESGDEAMTLRSAGSDAGDVVRVKRRGALPSRARIERGAVVYEVASEGVDAVVLALPSAVEELFVVHDRRSPLGYDIALPPGFSLRARPPGVVEIADALGRPRMRVTADKAWDALGSPIAVDLRVDSAGIELDISPGAALPAVVDPTFSEASEPVKVRSYHTATLLLDGSVLITGGLVGEIPTASAELYEAMTGTFRPVGSMGAGRAGHTATLLRSGKVLVVGGGGAEIFDPVTRSFTPSKAAVAVRNAHTATLLPSGKVLIAGGHDSMFALLASAELYDPDTDTSALTGPTAKAHLRHTATLLQDGRVVIASDYGLEIFDPAAGGGAGAFSEVPLSTAIWGDHTATLLRSGKVVLIGGWSDPLGNLMASKTVELYDPASDQISTLASFPDPGIADHRATLLPSGEVLITGGNAVQQGSSFLFDPVSEQITPGPDMITEHLGSTATLLPSGDVLVFGGTQAITELFVGRGGGQVGSFVAAAGNLPSPLSHAVASPLLDGRALIAGGVQEDVFWDDVTATAVASLYDPASGALTQAPSMNVARRSHSQTTLADGRVLIVGGSKSGYPLASVEVWDPAGGGGAGSFELTGSLATARSDHGAVLLPSGHVFVAGGTSEGIALSSAELYDPLTGAWTSLPPMSQARGAPKMVLVGGGKVLITSGDSAELFDPATSTFVATGPPGVSHDGVGATLTPLPGGKALLFGGTLTLSGEVYDPQIGAFAFTEPSSVARSNHYAVALANGKVLIGGGDILDKGFNDVTAAAELFDPRGAGGKGSFSAAPDMSTGRSLAAAALLGDGSVVIAGGHPCWWVLCNTPLLDTAEVFSETVGDAAWRPALTSPGAPLVVEAGTAVTITGSGLVGLEGADGSSASSNAGAPIAAWEPLSGGGIVFGTMTDWTSTGAVWTAPPTPFFGKGRLRVITNAIVSNAIPVEIRPASLAVACAYDAECASGFCSDGVCCDARCDEACSGCTAARKGSGATGVCGDVPPERDPADACVLSAGAPCSLDAQCATGLCVDGVCCTSACAGQCEACDKPSSVGFCVPVAGAPHGARPSCAAAADPCEAAVCDGVDRTSCAGKVGPCEPFACGAAACETSCAGDEGCAKGYHCDTATGDCVAGLCAGTIGIAPNGTEQDCSPYRCEVDGTCRITCGKVTDCAEGFVCDLAGRCIARPAAESLGGCQCTTPRRAEEPPLALVALSLALYLLRRRELGAARV